ncbi:ABC transporter substrate-binding protein [Cohaesibacter gelatinilyticus]|uniref:Amino acid ABC transporter substrate-binding protein, PAAT family n=1 Tax=Cohaesibacter gelatinilyticus TaxID=372072 RepID=A0A285NCV1_9HYPH|nr:ABC transporter substrate-binding protein [Cohaesibacter gelatinilyticus]SNZ07259.1 amino acid ABC transporter substrate-binding protein, PAAT family [Cohaesibacter gelatinilyticus]
MRFMKKLALTAAAVLMVAGAAEAADKIRIGTEGAYPPFNSLTKDGKLVGFDIDIANALCAEMKVECEFVVQDWDGMIPALMANKFDAVIASMSITEERLKKIDFSEKYYNTPPAIAVPKDSDMKDASPASLKGKMIGAQSSTTHSEYAEKKLEGIELKLYPTPDEYKLDLESGRIDGAVEDIVVLDEWVKSDKGACCKILAPLTPDPKINGAGAGVAVRKGETELANKFSAAIKAIRANGVYKEINDKYFEFDVYGGE